MVHLINGRGQLGKHLAALLAEDISEFSEEVYIYHTWSVLDKTEITQKKEYEKFKNFVNAHQDKKIIFVSSSSKRETSYLKYKHLSESYLLFKCDNGLIIRLPTIIGKGICEKLKYNEVKPYGIMELLSCRAAAKKILEYVKYNGMRKNITIEGEKISAELAHKLLQF